ncbi:MAG: hypothetical protein UX04_C0002G0168 [Microgenomates group bacterium GW2011_GWF2_45_18]|nr:MAG: hypothetical protein UW18_C0005G0005 [Microgenomates group bacterium GW2011_GWF1_44_10]KKU02025.1 MAG: hypothetical protein UX04_C0002G0168 [Microgenomates group bacterium GW2011_GWF2_45_18]
MCEKTNVPLLFLRGGLFENEIFVPSHGIFADTKRGTVPERSNGEVCKTFDSPVQIRPVPLEVKN